MDLILPGSLHLTTSGADFIEAQRSRFSELLIQADRIAIIGVRVRPWVKPTQPPQGAHRHITLGCRSPRTFHPP